MKKARIILAVIAILGVAGGSLAFKASQYGQLTYFTTDTQDAIAPAANAVPNAITNTTVGQQVYWTTQSGTAAHNFATVTSGN